MGARGPVPKRSSERRRRNKDSKPRKAKPAAAGKVKRPPVSKDWHPIAKSWFISLGDSGQAQFYEPSDWQLARIVAEGISRDLKPQVVGFIEDTGEPILADVPMKGASLAGYLKAMAALLVSEGDRRRARVELVRGGPPEKVPAGVTALDDYRRKLLEG